MNGFVIFALVFTLVPMVLLGLLGWFIGKGLETKYPKLGWLHWLGLGLGLLLGPIVGTMLSFTVAPCGFFGC
jgi:hypothetical protein